MTTPKGRPAGLHPALSVRQGSALLQEAESVRNLMRDSVLAIRGMRFVSARGDAVFALGSIGTEKAMKVLLGCAAVEDTGSWPTKPARKDWATMSRSSATEAPHGTASRSTAIVLH